MRSSFDSARCSACPFPRCICRIRSPGSLEHTHRGTTITSRSVSQMLQPDSPISDAIAFNIGREVGRIRLKHTEWWDELLISYIVRIPVLRTPLMHLRAYSADRYGAFLEPGGIRGLIALSSRSSDAPGGGYRGIPAGSPVRDQALRPPRPDYEHQAVNPAAHPRTLPTGAVQRFSVGATGTTVARHRGRAACRDAGGERCVA